MRANPDHFGTGIVNKVYAAFTAVAGINESSEGEVKNWQHRN